MNPYSHIVVASKLETLVDPASIPEFYWGAIAPDIRYLAAMQRHETHIPLERIMDLVSQYPHLKSFLQGYLVHCLCDEIDLWKIFFRQFPLSFFKIKMSRPRITAILELYYFESERVNREISGSHNEFLRDFGLSELQSTKFSQSISQYINSTSFESRITDLAGILGLENNTRIDRYISVAKDFQKNWLLKNALFFGIKMSRVSEQIVSMAASWYRQSGM